MSPDSIGLLIHDLCKSVPKSFNDSTEYDVHQARSEGFINVFLRGDEGDQLPLGDERTHFLCDLSFLRWLLVDKLDWNETPLSKEHRQLRWKYSAPTLDSMLTRTMEIVLTYDVVLDGPELMAGSKLWLHHLKSVKNDLAARNDPEDSIMLRNLEAIVRLLVKADDPAKTKEVKDLSQLTDAFALAAMFRRFKMEGELDWDLNISLLICALEHRVKTDYLHKSAKKSDTVWPTNDQIGDLIENLQYDKVDHPSYEPDYVERLLRVRPKLDMLKKFDHMHDVDAIINLLEEAQVKQLTKGSESGKLGESISDLTYVGAQHDFEILSSLLLEKVYGLTKVPCVRDAMGLRFDDIYCVAEQLVSSLCHYDIDDDLERIMSILRKLRYWANIRRLSKDQQTVAFPRILQGFLQDLPTTDRYQRELRQKHKQWKADVELLEIGKIALCQESHGREKSGWALDAASFLVIFDAKAAFKDTYPASHIKGDFDIDHELRIMPPILRSYPLDEVCPSPALYYRTKATEKQLQLPRDHSLVEEMNTFLRTMERCPNVQAFRANRREEKLVAMRDDRIAHGKLLGYVQSPDEVIEATLNSDWCVIRNGWSRDLSFMIFLFRRKLAQVSRKAAWSVVPGSYFMVDRQIRCMLRILHGYESADMHNEGDLQAQLVETQEKVREFEYLPEWEELNKLVIRIEEANELHTLAEHDSELGLQSLKL